MKRSGHVLRLALTGAVALTLFAGCGGCGEDEKPAPTQETVAPTPVPKPEPRVEKVEPQRGLSVAEQLETTIELPSYYPPDAPVYPGAKVNTAKTSMGRISLIFSSQDSREDVADWMNVFFASEGWGDFSVSDVPSVGMNLQGSKGRRKLGVLLISSVDGDGEEVTLLVVATDP